MSCSPDLARDPLVAGLVRVERAGPGMRHGEQREGRQPRPGEVVGDPVVHLPVRHEADDLVAGERPDRRASGAPGRNGRCAGGRAGRGVGGLPAGARAELGGEDDGDGDDDGTDADEGPSGHRRSVGPAPDRVNRAGRDERRGPGRRRRGGDRRCVVGPPALVLEEVWIDPRVRR